jgi:hypothetical protein
MFAGNERYVAPSGGIPTIDFGATTFHQRLRGNPERRFWFHVVRDPDTECWEWTAARKNGGYGSFFVDGRHLYAHRFAYEMLVGPIPSNLELDHLCRNRGCANPAHLEPVTRRTNVLRGAGPERLRQRNVRRGCEAKIASRRDMPAPASRLQVPA